MTLFLTAFSWTFSQFKWNLKTYLSLNLVVYQALTSNFCFSLCDPLFRKETSCQKAHQFMDPFGKRKIKSLPFLNTSHNLFKIMFNSNFKVDISLIFYFTSLIYQFMLSTSPMHSCHQIKLPRRSCFHVTQMNDGTLKQIPSISDLPLLVLTWIAAISR